MRTPGGLGDVGSIHAYRWEEEGHGKERGKGHDEEIVKTLPAIIGNVMVMHSEMENIPILPKAFLNFASKSSIGPSYAAHGP